MNLIEKLSEEIESAFCIISCNGFTAEVNLELFTINITDDTIELSSDETEVTIPRDSIIINSDNTYHISKGDLEIWLTLNECE